MCRHDQGIPKIAVVITQVGVGAALLGTDGSAGTSRVMREEDGGVVNHNVVVSLGRVKLKRCAAWIAVSVRVPRSPATMEKRIKVSFAGLERGRFRVLADIGHYLEMADASPPLA
jgi:hypothetical protein